jgi:WD repeat-containing protein 55
VVGTQIGILSVFNRSSGWGDCVDRVPGCVPNFANNRVEVTEPNSHPHSIDTLCGLPTIPNIDTSSTILTGSSDGFIRAVQMFPTKLLGVVADHNEWPVERINIGSGIGGEDIEEPGDKKGKESGTRVRKSSEDGECDIDEGKSLGQGRLWVGSAGHDEVLRMTDLNAFLVPKDGEAEEDEEEQEQYLGGEGADDHELEDVGENKSKVEEESDEDNESDTPMVKKKRKRKQEKDPLAVKKKKGRNEMESDGAFFDGI